VFPPPRLTAEGGYEVVKENKNKVAVQVELPEEKNKKRMLTGVQATVFWVVALAYGIFQFYTAGYGPFPNLIQRAIHIGFGLVLAFALFMPKSKDEAERRVGVLDWALIVLSVLGTGWVIVNYDRFMLNPGQSENIDVILAGITVILILEASRRVVGTVFVIIASATLLYGVIGPYLPGMWAHRGFGLDFMAEHLYMTDHGIWGTTAGIMATTVATFILFGAVLARSGGGQAFIDIACYLGGRAVGGPAKVAIISSAFFGMVNGSAAANVAVTGSFTIPMMKRVGYPREFAGAVEATASTGGQIMPPIMGAAAFIIAEHMKLPYTNIMIAAAIPALLYYVGVFMSVHFFSLRNGMRGLTREEMPDVKETLNIRNLVPLVIPLGFLLFLLFRGTTATLAGFAAMCAAAVLYILKDIRPAGLKKRARDMVEALVEGGREIVLIALLGAAADIVIGMLSLTGLGIKLTDFIFGMSAGHLMMGLVLGMLIALVLGMGLPTTAAYILGASVCGPALINMGITPMAAYLFIFYFATISAFTPPVCAAVYVASGIAGSNWLKTGWIAVLLGAAAFIVPYNFVFSNELIMIGNALVILWAAITATTGTVMLAGACMGNFFTNISIPYRVLLFAGALLLIKPGIVTDAIGFGIAVAVFLLSRWAGIRTQRALKG